MYRPVDALKCCLFIGFIWAMTAQAAQPKSVTQAELSSMAIYPKMAVSAQVIPNNNTVIRAQTGGEITHLPGQVGMTVNEGQILAQLGCDDQIHSFNQIKSIIPGTESKVQLIEWQLKQNKTLANQNNISQERYKLLEAELLAQKSLLDQQRTQMASMQLQVDRCQIKAPFTGVITAREAQLGDFIQPGAPLFKLLAHEDVEVQAFLHPDQINLIPQAKKLVFKESGKVYPVKIRSQVQGLDERTHTQEIRLLFTQAKPLAGTLGTLEWQDVRPHIPAALVTKRNNQLGIFLNQGDKARFYPLPDAKEGSPVAITHNFKGQIILEGRHQLEDGVSIMSQQVEGSANEVA